MTTLVKKIVRIGNSKGLRFPRSLIKKYHFNDVVSIEEKSNYIIIRSLEEDKQLSYDETFRAMSKAKEDWSDFDSTTGDGIE